MILKFLENVVDTFVSYDSLYWPGSVLVFGGTMLASDLWVTLKEKYWKTPPLHRGWVRHFQQNIWIPVPNLLFRRKHKKRLEMALWHYAEVNYRYPTAAVTEDMEDATAEEATGVPTEVMYLVRAIRTFGYFDRNTILHFWKECRKVELKKGEFLFKIGDNDDSIYIVMSGLLHVRIKEPYEDEPRIMRHVEPGGHLNSRISFINCICDNVLQFVTVDAIAEMDSAVMKLPIKAFKEYWDENPALLPMAIRRVMRRMYEVMFIALHKMLGLAGELTNPGRRISIYNDFPEPIGSVSDLDEEEAITALMDKLELPPSSRNRLDGCICSVIGPEVINFGDSPDSVELIFVHKGELQSTQIRKSLESESDEAEIMTIYVSPGEIMGGFSLLTNSTASFEICAPIKAFIIRIPIGVMKNLFKTDPLCVIPLCKQVISRLSPFARQVDFGMEFTILDSGRTLYRENDQPDSIYLVLQGRLHGHSMIKGKKAKTGEYGRYEWVGLIESVTRKPRRKSIQAVRETELARISYSVLDMVKRKFPVVCVRLLDFFGESLSKVYSRSGVTTDREVTRRNSFKFSTLTIIPLSHDLPYCVFAMELKRHYEPYAACCLVTPDDVRTNIGNNITSKNEPLMQQWLGKLELHYDVVFYLAEPELTVWTMKCIKQADVILFLTSTECSPQVTSMEELALAYGTLARKELVLLHSYHSDGMTRPNRGVPRGTKKYLENRPWLKFHHHVRIPAPAFSLIGNRPAYEIEETYEHLQFDINKHSDLARLTRWLANKSVGVVLGGGGAKGAAHLGFLYQLELFDIPIDMICGVSIGSLISALYSIYQDAAACERDAMKWFKTLAETWRFVFDVTFPWSSILKSEGFNSVMKDVLHDIQIEDLWIPYFNLSCDLTGQATRMHQCGLLWRYMRASMSLIKLFPPMVDPRDGHYLMDGGYANLVPVDVMKDFGAHYIFAIDISSSASDLPAVYGDSLPLFQMITHTLLSSFNSYAQTMNVKLPHLFELHERLTFIQGIMYLKIMESMDIHTVCVRPPVDIYAGSMFSKFMEILNFGCQQAAMFFQGIDPDVDLDTMWINLNKIIDKDFDLHIYNDTTYLDWRKNYTTSNEDELGLKLKPTASLLIIPTVKPSLSTDERQGQDEGNVP